MWKWNSLIINLSTEVKQNLSVPRRVPKLRKQPSQGGRNLQNLCKGHKLRCSKARRCLSWVYPCKPYFTSLIHTPDQALNCLIAYLSSCRIVSSFSPWCLFSTSLFFLHKVAPTPHFCIPKFLQVLSVVPVYFSNINSSVSTLWKWGHPCFDTLIKEITKFECSVADAYLLLLSDHLAFSVAGNVFTEGIILKDQPKRDTSENFSLLRF